MKSRLLGGLLILVIGVLYIAFEKSLLVRSAPSRDGLASDKADGLSRLIVGVQVCYQAHSVPFQY